MKHLSLTVALVALIPLLSVPSFATAPQFRDVPDIQVIGSSNVNVNLQRYAADIDDLLSDLTYDATRAVTFNTGLDDYTGGSQVASNDDGRLVIPGVAAGNAVNVVYEVGDAPEVSAFEASELRGVAALIASPALTSDARLVHGIDASTPGALYTYPVWATSATATGWETRSVPGPRTSSGDPATATQWGVKISALAVDVIPDETYQIASHYYFQRNVMNTGQTSITTPQTSALSVTVGVDGSLVIDPANEFTYPMVLGVKGIQSGSAESTKDYIGGTVMVPPLVDTFAGVDESYGTGFPFGINTSTFELEQTYTLPIESAYYFDTVSVTSGITMPTGGARVPLGSPGETPWVLGTVNNDGAVSFSSMVGTTAPLGNASVVTQAALTAINPDLSDPRFTSGNLVKLNVQSPSEPVANTVARAVNIELSNLVLTPGKVYQVSYSAFADLVQEGFNEAFLFTVIGIPNYLHAKTYVLPVRSNTTNSYSFPEAGWRKVALKYEMPDLSDLAQGQVFQNNIVNLELRLLAKAPFETGQDPWDIDLYIDNVEIYEVPGYDCDMALGNWELFGVPDDAQLGVIRPLAYPQIVPTTRGLLIGDFEGVNLEIGSANPVSVPDLPNVTWNTGDRPAGYETLANLGWEVDLTPQPGDGAPFGLGDTTQDLPANQMAAYGYLVVTTAENHFTTPYAADNPGGMGRSVRMHPGMAANSNTNEAFGTSAKRLSGNVALNGANFENMIAAINDGVSFSGTDPQTIAVRWWTYTPASYATDYNDWPNIYLALSDTGSSFQAFSGVMYHVEAAPFNGRPGEWVSHTTELDFPNGVAEHNLTDEFNAIPGWGPPGTVGVPNANWSTRFLDLQFQVYGFREAAPFLYPGMSGEFAPGSTAGTNTLAEPVTTGFIYLDDVTVMTSALESNRYYDRNYFEDTDKLGVDPLP